MKKKLLLVVIFLMTGVWTFAQENWILVNSNLAGGQGIGQISVGMDDPTAFWAHGIDNTGAIVDVFTKSTDSGETWTAGTFNAGTGLSMLFAIDANVCWAVFNTNVDQGLYKTEDGGATWEKKGTAYSGQSFADVIHFFNDNDGCAMGDPVGGYFEIYTTTDGGETWTRVPQANITGPLAGEYGITGNLDAVGDNMWFGTNKGRIFRSTDKGYNWTAYNTAFSSSTVVDCRFKDAMNGIAYRSYLDLGIEPVINVTSDGGQTWTSVTVNGDMYGRYFDYIPGTDNTYISSSFATGQSGVSYSTDGGYNWITLSTGYPFQAMAWLDDETGYCGTVATAARSTGGMYIWDGPPIGTAYPAIEVTPTAFDVTVSSGEMTTETMTISNTGTDNLTYTLNITYDVDNPTPFQISDPVTQVLSMTHSEPVLKSDCKPSVNELPSTDDVVLHYDSDDITNAIGWTVVPVTVQVAARFPSSMVLPYYGMTLSSVDIYLNDPATDYYLYIYGMGTPGAPGDLLYSEAIDLTEYSWNHVVLSTPVTLDGGDLWVAYGFTQTDLVYPAGVDAGPQDPNGDWLSSGSGWSHLGSTLPYNWHIRGNLTGSALPQWLTLDQYSGTVVPGGSDDITVTFDASELPEGVYGANITVTSNDPYNSPITIPVTLNVEASAYEPPSNLAANVVCYDVDLTWDAPSVTPLGYNVYRDNVQINPELITDLSYTDMALDPGTYSYTVTAVYDGGESLPAGPAIAEVVFLAPVSNLLVSNEPGSPDVMLTWEHPGNWIHWDDGTNYDGIGLTGGGFFYVAVRFNTDFLADYDGMNLTKIALFPRGPNTTYVLKVWTGSEPPTEIYSQDLSDLIIDEWNEIVLTTPVTIDATQDLWFGYSCDQPADDYPAGSDAGPAVVGFGDLISMDATAWDDLATYGIDENWNLQGWVQLPDGITVSLTPPVMISNAGTPGPSRGIPAAGHLPKALNAVFTPSSRALDGYNVYRNDVLLTETPITDLFYSDMGLENGHYVYCVTAVYDEVCESEAMCGEVDISVGIDEHSTPTVTIYPNPATGFVNMVFNTEIKSVTMMNIVGQVVYVNNKVNSNEVLRVNVSSFEPGIYFIQAQTGNGMITKKLTVY